MSYDITFSTEQPSLLFTGLKSVTAGGSYDAAVPTATVPADGTASHLLFGTLNGQKPNLLHLVPVMSGGSVPTSSNTTGATVRVVGWSVFTQSTNLEIYVPRILAEVSLTMPASSTASLSVNGTTTYWFNTATVGLGVPQVNVYSPGTASATNVQPAGVLIDTVGSRYVTAQYKITTAPTTPTMGLFWATI